MSCPYSLPNMSTVLLPDRRSQHRSPPSVWPEIALAESEPTSRQLAGDSCKRVKFCRYVLRDISQTINDRSADPVIAACSLRNNRTHVILC